MAVDSDLLGSCGLLLEKGIFQSGRYSLSRVSYRGRKLIAEISGSRGIFQHRWPSVRGLISPESARDLPGSQKLLLFNVGEGRFLSEEIRANGGFAEEEALQLVLKTYRILTDLQSAGMICGYIGPEMLVRDGDRLFLLAGRRGVPESPFTPMEVGRARPSDPRSDISALGSLLFRLISGTDDRDKQLAAWSKLSDPFRKTIQKMVEADPVNRPGSLRASLVLLEKLADSHENEQPAPLVHSETFARKEARKTRSSRSRTPWFIGIPLVLITAFLVFRFSGPPEREEPVESLVPQQDSILFEDTVEGPSPWSEDTLSSSPGPSLPDAVSLQDTARVWVINCTGEPGIENGFRAGPLQEFSYVFPLEGTTRRRTSLITVRRESPSADYRSSGLWTTAESIAGSDSGIHVAPVDLTVLLGTDLRYAGVNSNFLPAPAAPPSDTLFVDVVNHGIQYSLDGLGAATYFGGILDGRSCTVDGTSYLISVIDIRDADGFHQEIGIPESLEETIFLRHGSNHAAEVLEGAVRQYVQALPVQSVTPPESIPVPHLHILLGRP